MSQAVCFAWPEVHPTTSSPPQARPLQSSSPRETFATRQRPDLDSAQSMLWTDTRFRPSALLAYTPASHFAINESSVAP